jgi:DNA modification methylase
MQNRFNRLTSKEWLPFQKSWFRFKGTEELYEENIRFFCKAVNEGEQIFYSGNNIEKAKSAASRNGEKVISEIKGEIPIQFAIFDLLETITEKTNLATYQDIKKNTIETIEKIYPLLLHRRFIAIYIRNIEINGTYYPYAWDLAKEISSILSLKDEKIACCQVESADTKDNPIFSTNKSTFYCLFFRKDENSLGVYSRFNSNLFSSITQQPSKLSFKRELPSWFILKPQPRKKNEILHPAKYPEDLVDIFLDTFTLPGHNVLDPMSGTGSTQLGALRNNRNGYGAELSEFFTEIAQNRCNDYLKIASPNGSKLSFQIVNMDARKIDKSVFPPMDYMLTSPPYWDMLNMKGAENQAKRIEKGLQTNYSDDDKDLGNIADYNLFVNSLFEIYSKVIDSVKPGSYLTIVVKNIKKKGRNYPFAWDLTALLQQKLILLPEAFWCQDDISIAPYGYGNTWVSNTFHQYCLNFQKPL